MKYWQWLMGAGLSLVFGFSPALHAFSIPQPAKEVAASKLAHIRLNASLGEADAQYLLALMNLSGRFLPRDNDTGVKWLALAAEQGHLKAQKTLADLSFEGKIISRDLAVAEHWYLQMGQQGNRWAQFRLGFIYAAGGQGVERHCGKAMEQFNAVGDRIALGNVAWILSTCPEARYRDGDKALSLALQLLESDAMDPTNLDNLAAAYAELGDFDAAVKTQKQAIDALRLRSELVKIDEFKQRLQEYEQHKPYREVLPLLLDEAPRD